jgi:hypothetical protein
MSRLSVGWLLAVFLLLAVTPAQAQEPSETRAAVPDIPTGEGRIVGRVVHPSDDGEVGGLPIGLYSLAADGSPSMRETTTDAKGNFRFEGISNSSGVVYLVGTRYREISYGERGQFEPDEAELKIDLEVSDPTTNPADISIENTTLELGWFGGKLAVQERIQINNAGERVFYQQVKNRKGERAPVRAQIPETASNLRPALGILAENFELELGSLRYWGAIYPGVGEVAYSYLVDQSGDSQDGGTPLVRLRRQFPDGSKTVLVLVPIGSPAISATGLTAGADTEIDGRLYQTLIAENLTPGAEIELLLKPPTGNPSAELLQVKQANVWLELDDTVLDVNMDYLFAVDAPDWIAGTAESPLLHVDLPANAEFRSVSSTVDQLGVEQSPGGGVDVIGPVPPGESRLSIRYRMPVNTAGSTGLDLRFPFRVPLLNVFVADTGIVVENDRLHRRRPTRSGTRLYLHREAFQIEPDETLHFELRPLKRQPFSNLTILVPFLIAACCGAWFMVSPLRKESRTQQQNSDATSTRIQREAIYEAIRDLDHDFETGKLNEEDHQRMRETLRAQAKESMRQENESSPAQPADADTEDLSPTCPQCAVATEPQWTFCSNCGAPLGAGDLQS